MYLYLRVVQETVRQKTTRLLIIKILNYWKEIPKIGSTNSTKSIIIENYKFSKLVKLFENSLKTEILYI